MFQTWKSLRTIYPVLFYCLLAIMLLYGALWINYSRCYKLWDKNIFHPFCELNNFLTFDTGITETLKVVYDLLSLYSNFWYQTQFELTLFIKDHFAAITTCTKAVWKLCLTIVIVLIKIIDSSSLCGRKQPFSSGVFVIAFIPNMLCLAFTIPIRFIVSSYL